MSEKNEGMCVGGQQHGTMVSCCGSMLQFTKMQPAPATFEWGDIGATGKLDMETYFFETIRFQNGEVNFWRNERLTTALDAVEFMFNLAAKRQPT